MTDLTARDITIDLSFLGEGSFSADIFSDGMNAAACPEDYAHSKGVFKSSDKINVHLAPGGGWTAQFRAR